MKLGRSWGRLGMKSEWMQATLDEVCALITDGAHNSPKSVEMGYYMASVKNFTDFGFDFSDCRKISKTDYEKLRKQGCVPEKGDILVGKDGARYFEDIVIYNQDEEPALLSSIAILRVDDKKITSEFLYYTLKTPIVRKDVRDNYGSGSAIPRIVLKDFRRMPFSYPSIEEQKKITTICSTIDFKIQLNNKINENLLEQMKALYKSWFVDFEPFNGKQPQSWHQNNIYSLANIIYGAPFSSKQFNTDGNGKPIIRIRDLKEQRFATYTTEKHPKGYLLQPGDIVVGMDGEFRPYIWGNDEAWLNQRVCVFDNIRPEGKAFLYFTIKPLLYAIEQTQVATTVIHIGKKDFDAFKVIIPETTVLNRFDAITSPMVKQIISNSFENKQLASLRDALLPKLMSGELDVSNLDI